MSDTLQARSDLGSSESARDRYLAIVAPVNEVVLAFNAATNDTTKGQLIQDLYVVLTVAISEIEDVDWPPDTNAAARELLVATNAASAAARCLVREMTDAAAQLFAFEVAAMADASSNMRTALGLPTPSAP